MKYPWCIKIRSESWWDKIGGGSGIIWKEFGRGYNTKTEAILGAIKASRVFEEQFIVSSTNFNFINQEICP